MEGIHRDKNVNRRAHACFPRRRRLVGNRLLSKLHTFIVEAKQNLSRSFCFTLPQTREMMREERELSDERRLAAKMVAQAKLTGPRLAKMHAVSEYRGRWVTYQVRVRTTTNCGTSWCPSCMLVHTPGCPSVRVLFCVSVPNGCAVSPSAQWPTSRLLL